MQVAKLESLIRMLYDVEDQIRSLGEAERLARRQSLSRHVLGLIERYLASEAMSFPVVLPKSNLGQAAAYGRCHWEALVRYTEDASIPIDNNDCEHLMKRVAVGRKNWLFKGSVATGQRAVNLMTIVATQSAMTWTWVPTYTTSWSARWGAKRTGRQWPHTRGRRSILNRFARTAKRNGVSQPTASEPAAPAVA